MRIRKAGMFLGQTMKCFLLIGKNNILKKLSKLSNFSFGFNCNFLNFQSMWIAGIQSKTFQFLKNFFSKQLKLKYCFL